MTRQAPTKSAVWDGTDSQSLANENHDLAHQPVIQQIQQTQPGDRISQTIHGEQQPVTRQIGEMRDVDDQPHPRNQINMDDSPVTRQVQQRKEVPEWDDGEWSGQIL